MFDREQQDRYIQTIRRVGRRAQAAAMVGVSSETVRRTAEKDAEFKAREGDARQAWLDDIEDVALKRALEGYEETVTEYDSDGEVKSRKVARKQDNALLHRLMERVAPTTRKSSVELSGKIETTVGLDKILASLNEEQQKLLDRIIEIEVAKRKERSPNDDPDD